jgi:hypothetical protein
MTMNINLGIGCSNSNNCLDAQTGCPDGVAPDFCLKRNDTTPPFKINLEDCDGVVDLTENYALQVSMWISSKLKKSINSTETTISFADNIGFDQVKQNNILIMNRARNPEKMQIISFNENEKTIVVTRGYDNTTPQSWAKGSSFRVFRLSEEDAEIESVFESVEKEDGTILEDQLSATFLSFSWTEDSTSLPGCYWLEFKLTELNEDLSEVLSVRRFPSSGEGFLVKVNDSAT